MNTLRLPTGVRDELIRHALTDYPREACGVLSGEPGAVTRIHPARNCEDADRQFEVDPRDLLSIVKDVNGADEQIIAIYHSHPSGSATLSERDLAFAAGWPGVVQIVVGVQGDEVDMRAYRPLSDSEAVEVAFEG
jgi:proteasome lid subunit RPN8/RPN11